MEAAENGHEVLVVFEVLHLQGLFEETVGFFEGVGLDEANDSIDLHDCSLVGCQVLVLLQLNLNPLSKLFPVERPNHFFESRGVQAEYITQCIDVQLYKNVVLDCLRELEPSLLNSGGHAIFHLRVVVVQLAKEVHLLNLESSLLVLEGLLLGGLVVCLSEVLVGFAGVAKLEVDLREIEEVLVGLLEATVLLECILDLFELCLTLGGMAGKVVDQDVAYVFGVKLLFVLLQNMLICLI